VEQQAVAVARVGDRDDIGLAAPVDDADVGHEAGVEDRVESGAVLDRLLGDATHPGPL
jgi:hypothetical protein